ncbi:MAG: hypothetical protein WBD70_20570 [Mycobacterium sp.]
MTATTPTVTLPPGFDHAGDWEASGADMPYRLIWSADADRTITDHAVRLELHAFQFADGSIASRWLGESPGIAVPDGNKETGIWPLNNDQARELAAALLAAADELDGMEAQR